MTQKDLCLKIKDYLKAITIPNINIILKTNVLKKKPLISIKISLKIIN